MPAFLTDLVIEKVSEVYLLYSADVGALPTEKSTPTATAEKTVAKYRAKPS